MFVLYTSQLKVNVDQFPLSGSTSDDVTVFLLMFGCNSLLSE